MHLKAFLYTARNKVWSRDQQLVEDAKVRNGDSYDIGLRHDHVLSMDFPDTRVREIECALGLALINPLEATHNVRIIGTCRCDGEHSYEASRIAR